MNVAGYLLMRQALGEYRGVQDRVYAWPEHESDELALAFIQTTHEEPFDFVFRVLEDATRAASLAAEFERDLSVVEVGISADAKDLAAARLPIGVDIAYPGGAFYSAVYNGLLSVNAAHRLQERYGRDLNVNKLFDSSERAADYLQSFRSVAPSERDSEFVFYALGSLERVQ